jgi:hypothetical protein
LPLIVQLGIAVAVGVAAASMAGLIVWVMHRRRRRRHPVDWFANRPPASEHDPRYVAEHSILPDSVPRAADDSDPFSHGSFNERRGAPRRKGNPVDVLLSDAKAEVEPVHGLVIDRSLTGLALELDQEGEVDIGTIISVRPSKGEVWIRVIVRRREQTRSGWVLGCEFVRPPDSTSMLHFG